MTDDQPVLYRYTAVPGFRAPDGVPMRDLTARDVERMLPHHRREIKALANAGLLFTAANKATATRALNKARAAEVEAAEAVAQEGDN